MFNPRPGQHEVVDYTSGKMGISAVPGSGKTHTLSYLAAKLVASANLAENQEILIVTLVNSAVDNFSSRVAGFLREFNLLPGIGYRVRTLHGLAYDIIREKPGLAGLDNHFSITDERASIEILNLVVDNWKRTHTDFIGDYTDPNQSVEKLGRDWTELLGTLASSFIKQAKDYQLTPESLRTQLDNEQGSFPLLEIGYSVYLNYQQALAYRGAVDFEDLIRLAYKVLRNNEDYLQELRYRWPIILEDEAQDSSMIQEKLLRLLCGESGNWVRVGDPNQAIFETFTTAEPRLLREFLKETEVTECDLKYSGRSTRSIIDLANYLNRWTQKEHPVPELRDTLSDPFIHPTLPGDPQPNPPDNTKAIFFHAENLQPEKEIILVANSVKKWLAEKPQGTVAVLVPRNARGVEMADQLASLKVPLLELLRSSKSTRDTAQILLDILSFYAHPTSKKHLSDAAKSIICARFGKKTADESAKDIKKRVNEIEFPEKVIGQKINTEIFAMESDQSPSAEQLLDQVFQYLSLWQQVVLLPIDQMIMTISIHLFEEPVDLALAHKLAVLLKEGANLNPVWRLSDFCRELDEIAHNRFRLYGFSTEDTGFDPDHHKGEVVVSTIHKAKGLEWDRVYLLSVNNYDFPSAQSDDSYISEKWFVRDRLNLEAEMISQLKALVQNDRISLHQPEGQATQSARLDYSAERIRLLYVGITRARKELVITKNTGRNGKYHEAIPITALRNYWEGRNADQS